MNSAKKMMNQQNEDGKKSKKTTTTPVANAKQTKGFSGFAGGDVKKIVISVLCIAVVLVLCIGVGIQQFQPQLVMKINDTKFSLNDMMYPIYERESQYLPYNEMYESYTGSSVWDNSYMGSDSNVASGTKNADGLKTEIQDQETEFEVLYQEAEKAGYKLSAKDEKKVEAQVTKALKGLSFIQKLKLCISKGKLTKRFEKRQLANNYMADKKKETNKTVDEAKAKKTVSKKDYREYDIQYYSVSTNTTDKTGSTVSLSKAKKEEALKKLETVAKKAETAKDFTKLVDSKETTVKYQETNFTEKDGWSAISDKKILKSIKALKNNEISGIFKDEAAGVYLFVKMTNNNSTKAYTTACDNAVSTAQDKAFDTWYRKVLKNYKVKINAKVWGTVTIGTVTTDIVTAADLEKMNASSKSSSSASSSSK